MAEAGAAVVALMTATALPVYEPRGLTPIGRKPTLRGSPERAALANSATPLWVELAWTAVAAAVNATAVVHVMGGGLGTH